MNTAVKLGFSVLLLSFFEGLTEANVSHCFHRMKTKTGSFKSPMHPQPYPSNQFCEYVIKGEPDYYIEITFTKFKLEPLYKGNKTDYIRILDGGKNNRKRELTYDGSQREGFTYTSLTSRVFINFHSDGQFGYSGFHSTYKMVARECSIPVVENGLAKCNVNGKGHARTCEVECDEFYILDGDSEIFCQGTEFNKLPKCFQEPSENCDMKEVQHLRNLDCEKNPETELETCTFECPKNYFPPENNEINCIEGIWDRIPKCVPRPTVDCDLADVNVDITECERDPVTNVTTKCGFTCKKLLYVAVNDLICNNGTWGEPNCIPNPDIMDSCLNGSLLVKDEKVGSGDDNRDDVEECPFDAKERESYMKAFFDDMKDINRLPDTGRGAGIKRYECSKNYCLVRRPGMQPVINCHEHSFAMKRRYNMREKRRIRREEICFKCRLNRCKTPAIFFS